MITYTYLTPEERETRGEVRCPKCASIGSLELFTAEDAVTSQREKALRCRICGLEIFKPKGISNGQDNNRIGKRC